MIGHPSRGAPWALLAATSICLLATSVVTAAAAAAQGPSGRCSGPYVASCLVSHPMDPPCLDTLRVEAIVSSAEWAEIEWDCGERSWSASGPFAGEGETVDSQTVCVSKISNVWDSPDACAVIQA